MMREVRRLQRALHSDQQFAKAAEAGQVALALSGRHVFALAPQAIIYADWGKLAAAKAIYAELVARGAPGHILPTHMARPRLLRENLTRLQYTHARR